MPTDPKMKKARTKLNKLVKKRKTLKERKAEGKITVLGNLRRKRIQKKINKNIAAKKDATKTTVVKKTKKTDTQSYKDSMTKKRRIKSTKKPTYKSPFKSNKTTSVKY